MNSVTPGSSFAELDNDLVKADDFAGSLADPKRWAACCDFYRKRGGVIFLSRSRFWEKHAFVQQSLARALVANGVPVVWLDGTGWRPYEPVIYTPSPLLTVRQLSALPLTRLNPIRQASLRMQAETVKRTMKQLGGQPVLWIQDGISEELAALIPYIDVYSVFDDPYAHEPAGGLASRAKLILCQNSFATHRFHSGQPEKTWRSLPPMDLGDSVFADAPAPTLPAGFPAGPAWGNIGSMMSSDFDFPLLEHVLDLFPDQGFVFMGRTDETGQRWFEQQKRRKNFAYLPWVPRSQVKGTWNILGKLLLLYRRHNSQDGAFPTRAAEALQFGIPIISTLIPKTQDLAGIALQGNSVSELQQSLTTETSLGRQDLLRNFEILRTKMSPAHHLIRVSEELSAQAAAT